MSKLKAEDFLIGPHSGWGYQRGRWTGGCEVVFEPREQRVVLRRHSGELAMLAQAAANLPTGRSGSNSVYRRANDTARTPRAREAFCLLLNFNEVVYVD